MLAAVLLRRVAAVETRMMPEAAAIIHVSRQGEEREVLPVHVVLEIEHARETGAGNLRLIPGAVRPLRRKKIPQATLHAAPIEIAARADAHERPRSLGRCAVALAF